MKQETEIKLQHLENMHTVLERCKHGLYSLHPHSMPRECFGIFVDMMQGIDMLQIDIRAAAFDIKNGEPKGEA